MLQCAFLFFQAKFSFRLEAFSRLHANPVLLKGQLTALRGRVLTLGGNKHAPSSLGLTPAFPILVCNTPRRALFTCRSSQTQAIWSLPLIPAKIFEEWEKFAGIFQLINTQPRCIIPLLKFRQLPWRYLHLSWSSWVLSVTERRGEVTLRFIRSTIKCSHQEKLNLMLEMPKRHKRESCLSRMEVLGKLFLADGDFSTVSMWENGKLATKEGNVKGKKEISIRKRRSEERR